jgi:hypothetical protein
MVVELQYIRSGKALEICYYELLQSKVGEGAQVPDSCTYNYYNKGDDEK